MIINKFLIIFSSENEYLIQVIKLQKSGFIIIAILFVIMLILLAFIYFDLIDIKNKNKVIAGHINKATQCEKKTDTNLTNTIKTELIKDNLFTKQDSIDKFISVK